MFLSLLGFEKQAFMRNLGFFDRIGNRHQRTHFSLQTRLLMQLKFRKPEEVPIVQIIKGAIFLLTQNI